MSKIRFNGVLISVPLTLKELERIFSEKKFSRKIAERILKLFETAFHIRRKVEIIKLNSNNDRIMYVEFSEIGIQTSHVCQDSENDLSNWSGDELLMKCTEKLIKEYRKKIIY